MKAIVLLFTSALFVIGALGLTHAQTNSSVSVDEARREALHEAAIEQEAWLQWSHMFVKSLGQKWMTNYYGKTMSSLGEIVTLRIDRRQQSSPAWTHRDVWQILEESKIQDQPMFYHLIHCPPVITIEYSDGMRVEADRVSLIIFLPDGRKGSAYLISKP